MTSPTMRQAVGLSFSQAQAISAPNIGTVAFRMDDSPVLMDSSAKAMQANGMPELSRPTTKVRRQCLRSSGSRPRSHTSGSRNSAAIATRTAAVGSAPNSTAPMRMNRNDEPQMAASSTKSVSQLLGLAVASRSGRRAHRGGPRVQGRLSASAPSSRSRAVLRSSPPA